MQAYTNHDVLFAQIQSSVLGEDHGQVEETRKAIEFICDRRNHFDPSKSVETTVSGLVNALVY